MNGVEINTRAYVATRLLLRWDYLYAVTLKTKVFGDYNHARLEVSWITSTRGLLLRGYTGSTPPAFVIVCMPFFVTAGCQIACSLWSCYQKYTHRQHLARLEESARGDAEGDRHHQRAAGNSLVRDSELSCNGPEGKAQPCTPNSDCSLSQDASARLTRSQVAKNDNKLCLFYQQETEKVKGSRQKLSNSVVTLALRHVLLCP